MERAYITLRATGERFYLDDGIDSGPEPPMLTCAVCDDSLPQWQFGECADGQPLICWGCGHGPTPQWAWGLSFADQNLICHARAVLGHITRETRHG